jgi:hypothetical protein
VVVLVGGGGNCWAGAHLGQDEQQELRQRLASAVLGEGEGKRRSIEMKRFGGVQLP